MSFQICKNNDFIQQFFFSSLSPFTAIHESTVNHWCHMDHFNNVLTAFLGHEPGDEWRSYGFGMTMTESLFLAELTFFNP